MAGPRREAFQQAAEAQKKGQALLKLLLTCDTVTPDIEEGVLNLIADNADVNVRGKNNVTPLLAACAKRSPRLVTALLDAGANINAQNDGGNAPIIMVSAFGPIEILKILLDRGAALNQKDGDGYTAYDWAYEKQGEAFVALIEAEEKKREAAREVKSAAGRVAREKSEEEARQNRIEKIAKTGKTKPSWRR
jgi:ankyrin repeat protein